MELNTATLADFVKNATILWLKGEESVPQTMRNSGLFKIVPIPQGTGDTREFSEIDLEEYADTKDQSDQAQRAAVQQGLTTIALVKSSLINGENLKTTLKWFKATLNKAFSQLQRLSEKTLNLSEAIVRTA